VCGPSSTVAGCVLRVRPPFSVLCVRSPGCGLLLCLLWVELQPSFVFVVGVGAASLVFAVGDLPVPAPSFVCCLEWQLGVAPLLCCRVGANV